MSFERGLTGVVVGFTIGIALRGALAQSHLHQLYRSLSHSWQTQSALVGRVGTARVKIRGFDAVFLLCSIIR